MRTATMAVIAVAWLLSLHGAVSATTVYWTPAPGLLPQELPLPGRLTWGDIDSDGDDDLSNGWQDMWRDGACPGLPAWRFGYGWLAPLSGCDFRQTALGDLDADGDMDVIYGCFDPGLHLFWNVGTPQAPQWQEDSAAVQGFGGHWSSPFLADLDDDGDLDLILVSTGGGVQLYENVGTPQAPVWTYGGYIPGATIGASSPRAVLADLDRDGDLDLIGTDCASRIKCWENTGTPQQWEFVRNDAMLTGVDQSITGWYVLALPDVDCDGDPDLVVEGCSNGACFLYLNETVTSVAPASWGAIKALYR